MSSAEISKLTFSKNYFRNTIRVTKSLDPDQDRHFVGPDLGPSCLQRLYQQTTEVDASRKRVIMSSTAEDAVWSVVQIAKL